MNEMNAKNLYLAQKPNLKSSNLKQTKSHSIVSNEI